MRYVPFLFLLVLVGCQSSQAESTTTARGSTSPSLPVVSSTAQDDDEGIDWVSEIDWMYAEARDLHPNLFWQTPESEFTANVEDLKGRVGQLTDDQVELEIIRLFALIDGHSAVAKSPPPLDYRRYQIRLYEFADGFHVVESTDPQLLGSRVNSINGVPVDEVAEAVEPYVQRDNDWTVKNLTPLFMVIPELLSGVGIVDDVESPKFELELADGTMRTVDPVMLSISDWFDWVTYSTVLPAREAVQLDDGFREAFWFEHLPEDSAIYFQYNQVTQVGSGTIGTVVRQMENLIADEDVESVVVDVRRNGGGNNTTIGGLVDFLTEADEEGIEVILLIGRQTFSAAANFVTAVEQATEATFVGEGIGGSPNLYGDVSTMVFPQSGITASISRRYWEFSTPDDARVTIEPDLPVSMTYREWADGGDPALELALSLAR